MVPKYQGVIAPDISLLSLSFRYSDEVDASTRFLNNICIFIHLLLFNYLVACLCLRLQYKDAGTWS